MQVLLTLEEANQVMLRMTSMILDNVELSEAARDAIREWRKNRALGTREADEFTLAMNEAMGNHIDERTTRRIRMRGGMFVTETEVGR